ncbi:MAG: carboxymuconolactone decarboxylase family protein [Chromatiales bacterium]|nr:MAG: carboxymuconolactone decarboxylase family protein [Chromatiales bacterium]
MSQPQPLLRKVPRDELPDDLQPAWDSAFSVTGDATFIEVSGNAPDSLRWYLQSFYQDRFYNSRLPRRVLELVRLRLANLHGCAFCNKGDRAQALAAGFSEPELDALPDYETGPFSDAERAALALADAMALTSPNGRLDDALYQRLKVSFDDGELYELGMIMAVLCGMAKFLFVFDLVEKEPSCPFG